MSTAVVAESLKVGGRVTRRGATSAPARLMGVAYGAASLWPWRLHPDEPGHGAYFLAEGAGWKEALDFEGSRYVGLVGKIVDDLPHHRGQPVLGCVRQYSRPARSGRPLHRLCRARWALDVLRCGWPGAFEVLADRSPYWSGAEVRRAAAELRAHRVRSL